jgi:hypothetical protein
VGVLAALRGVTRDGGSGRVGRVAAALWPTSLSEHRVRVGFVRRASSKALHGQKDQTSKALHGQKDQTSKALHGQKDQTSKALHGQKDQTNVTVLPLLSVTPGEGPSRCWRYIGLGT